MVLAVHFHGRPWSLNGNVNLLLLIALEGLTSGVVCYPLKTLFSFCKWCLDFLAFFLHGRLWMLDGRNESWHIETSDCFSPLLAWLT